MLSRPAVMLQMAVILGAAAHGASAADTERLSGERMAKIYAAYATLDPAASPDVLSAADIEMIKAAFAVGGPYTEPSPNQLAYAIADE